MPPRGGVTPRSTSALAAEHDSGLSAVAGRREVEGERKVDKGATAQSGARMAEGTRGGCGVQRRTREPRGGGGGCRNALKTEGATVWTPLRVEVVGVGGGTNRQSSRQWCQ